MSTPQRLPIVNADDGTWGEILRQYLSKEHVNDDLDHPGNGGHKNVTITAGTAGAGGAPLKFTSGTLLTTAEAGAMEFAGDNYYLTTASGSRKKVATYDEGTPGATGDIYYRSSGGVFTRLPVGSSGEILTVSSGSPSWQAPATDGDVRGPATATDNAVVRFDSTTGKLIQNSAVTIADTTGDMAGVGKINTHSLPSSDFVGETDTQTLTHKDLTSATNTFPTFNQDTTGNAATATKLQTARTIGGVSFDGTANINLPGVNTAGNQNTTGNAATATKLQTARTINGVSFDGTSNITINATVAWVPQSSSATGSVGKGYITTSGSLVTITLPSSFAVGDYLRVAGTGAGGWKIAQPAGDNIKFLDIATTTGAGGYLASTTNNDAVELVGAVANTTWNVISSVGNITVN